MATMYPEMPGYETKEIRLLKVYLPVDVNVLISALGGGTNSTMPYMPSQREVRLSKDGLALELWEMQQVSKKG